MEVIAIRYTRGDYCTQPGGVILRKKSDDEFVTHCFNREYGSKEPIGFYWGHYIFDKDLAQADFSNRVSRQSGYDTGGSLIPDYQLDEELEKERLSHASS
jgi:hypothetical protein